MVVRWERLALPVLQAIAGTDDRDVRDGILSLGHGKGASSLGLAATDEELHDALLALKDVDYLHIDRIEYSSGGNAIVLGARVTGRGMQALGQWPSLEAAMTPVTLVAVLERLQDYAPDKASREQLGEAVQSVKAAGDRLAREAVVSFGAEALRLKLGLR